MLQGRSLALLGVGILGDAPPNPIQPPLADGVHLRWAFQYDIGFPWYGFYLFRRPHQRAEPECLSRALSRHERGPLGESVLTTPLSTVSSDRPLVLTDDFPPSGVVEIDLANRDHVDVTLPAGVIAYHAEVQIGLREQRRYLGRCTRLDRLEPGGAENPLALADATFSVTEEGTPASSARIVDAPAATGPSVGLELAEGQVVEVLLAQPAPAVEAVLTVDGGTVVATAYDTAGNPRAEAVTTVGSGSERLVLDASPGPALPRLLLQAIGAGAVLHEVCAGGRAAPCDIEVSALFDGLPIGTEVVHGAPGEVRRLAFDLDAITAVRVSGGDAALIDVCWSAVEEGQARQGWELLEDFPYPMGLPVLHPDYPATGGAAVDEGAAESIALDRVRYGDPSRWEGGAFHDLHGELVELVRGGPGSTAMALRERPPIPGTPDPPAPGVTAPAMPGQRPLQLVLLGSLHRAIAEMLGLSWTDRTASPGVEFDYLLVADYTGIGKGDAHAVLEVIQGSGFADLEGFVVYAKATGPAPVLAPPADVRAYAVPGGYVPAPGSGRATGPNSVGLRWQSGAVPSAGGMPSAFLKPHATVLHHLWGTSLGAGEVPGAPPASLPLLIENAILVAEPKLPSGVQPVRPPDWPPFPLNTQVSGLLDGWWDFQVSGVDLLGRHTPNSASATWWQWAPAPDPRPWYYIDPPGDVLLHPAAVHLVGRIRPPAPTAIEAAALDPGDPGVVADGPYQSWRSTLSAAERDGVLGLRVSWVWTYAHMRQAPDVTEFRVYFHAGRMNALAGRTTSVIPATAAGECDVVTDIAGVPPAGGLAGSSLVVGRDTFPIVDNDGTAPLRVRVRNRGLTYVTGTASTVAGSASVTGAGTAWHAGMDGLTFEAGGGSVRATILHVDSPTSLTLSQPATTPVTTSAYVIFTKRPEAGSPCSVSIPAAQATGTVAVTAGSTTVAGTGTDWRAVLAGQPLLVEGHVARYRIASVDSPAQLTLDRPYAGTSEAGRVYSIPNPLFTDYTESSNWAEREYVVDVNSHVTVTTDAAGRPMRRYELFLPAAGDDDRGGLPLMTSAAEPMAFGFVGVSAADASPYAVDDPKWAAGRWGGRNGNEGPVGAPGMVFRVHRVPPPPPVPPPDSERVYATPADYQGASFYTFRWRPTAHLRTHVFRGLDERVFKADRARRPRTPLAPSDLAAFPSEAIEPRWDALKRTQVANELNHLNSFPHTPSGDLDAFRAYRALSNDGLRVLAALPGTEDAYAQVTIVPLDPGDPANANRRGPDDPPDFAVDPSLRAYLDTLDGRAQNRYLYRAAYVDGASNRGPLGLSGPPVWLPAVTPPRRPAWASASGGERSVSLAWTSNREPGLREYHVLRAGDRALGRDVRLMTLVHTEAVPAGDPASRPALVHWTDAPVPGLTDLVYRVVAVDAAGNVSEPSPPITVRASDEALPVVPALSAAWAPGDPPPYAVLSWNAPDRTLLERRLGPVGPWDPVTAWLPAGPHVHNDDVPAARTWHYRLRSERTTGAQATGTPAVLQHREP